MYHHGKNATSHTNTSGGGRFTLEGQEALIQIAQRSGPWSQYMPVTFICYTTILATLASTGFLVSMKRRTNALLSDLWKEVGWNY